MHMNFAAKEIAAYTHSSIRTIENRKYRIRKKLDLDSLIDLNKFLMNL
jgi:DNA-binding NarL/FixJ family response regulator